MQITRTSMLTGITRTMDLPITDEQYARWRAGTVIQVAMPRLSPDEREFIRTGITGDEWDAWQSKFNSEEEEQW